jgi:transcription initiation factor TFIID subunit 5
LELELAVDRIKNLAQRAALSAASLPSICCYTIQNSYGGVCSAEFSPSFNSIAIGHRESFIDVWSLTKERLKALRPSTELSAMTTEDLESVDQVFEPEGTSSKRLVGHAGPVYSCRFSPDGQFLFSGAQDCSVRLWSLGTFSGVAAYKSHYGPVWDVDVAATGHYFVSGSADRTARLWSTHGSQPLRMFVGHFSDVEVRRRCIGCLSAL